MSSKYAVWLAFFLNLSFAIVEFIAGGIFVSSAVLADSVHDLGDALAIGLSAFLETISNREEDSRYTLGYKRFSLLGALVTAVILMTGSGMVSILSRHFLEDTLGWLAVILMAIVLRFTDWYILDPLLSLAISFFILSKAIPRFWSTLKIFLDAVPEGVDIKQVKNDLEQLDNVASINQLNLWTMDGLEKNAIVHVCLEHVKHIEVCKESIRDLLKESGFQNVTIEVDEDLATHQAHKRNIEELEAESEQQHHH